MSINKIAVYQGGQWITENIAVQSSEIVGNIQSSQIDSIANTKITGLTNNSQAAVLAAVSTNGHLYVPTSPVLNTHLTGLTGNVQTQINNLSSSITNLNLSNIDGNIPGSKITGTINTSQTTIKVDGTTDGHVLIPGVASNNNLTIPSNPIQYNILQNIGLPLVRYNGNESFSNFPTCISFSIGSAERKQLRIYSTATSGSYPITFIGMICVQRADSGNIAYVFDNGSDVYICPMSTNTHVAITAGSTQTGTNHTYREIHCGDDSGANRHITVIPFYTNNIYQINTI